MVLTYDHLSDTRFDAITADNHISFCGGTVSECHFEFSVEFLVNVFELFVEARNIFWNQLDYVIEESCSMNSVLAKAVRKGEGAPVSLRVLGLAAIVEVEPHPLFGGAQIRSTDLLRCLINALVAQLHGLDGFGTEAHSGADLAKCACLLIDSDRDLSAVQSDC